MTVTASALPNLSTADLQADTTQTTAKTTPRINEINNGENVADRARRERATGVQSKFFDILQVNASANCDSIEVDLDSYSDDINVNASLSSPSSVEFFRRIGASDFILDTLINGHKSTLSEIVHPYERRNNKSFFEHEEFAIKSILELVEKGKVELVSEKPHIVNPLSVAVQRNKNRLILDCSHLNQFVEVPKFKYEDVKEALNYFEKGCHMIKWDLKNGYHQIKIHPEFRKYLGFKFTYKGKDFYGQHTVGPFGLRDLPYLFTKIFRVFVKHWRSCGLYVVMFLDDGIMFAKSKEDAELGSIHIRKDLFRASAFWSIKKSCWDPVKVCEWLGFIWDSNDASLAAAPHRVEKIKATTASLLISQSCHIKKLASFTGQIISLTEVVGNCSRLTTRCSQIAVAAAPSWDCIIDLSDKIHEELKFWLSNIDLLNKKCCFDQKPPSILNVIESDASDSGCGSLLNAKSKALRLFSEFERAQHSTYRELMAVSHAIGSFLPRISNSKVKVFVDNQSAARIIDVGSMKIELHEIAMGIFFTCLKNGISLDVEWIPRNQNEAADAASREAIVVDTDDWQITDDFFNILNRRWGSFTVDCFANSYNNKVDQFFSLFNSPNCAGVDAFSFDWEDEFCLLVPPVCIVGTTLQHLRVCRGKGVLVVPFWPSAAFWPMLINDFNVFIKDFLKVKGKNVLKHGYNCNSLLGSQDFKGNVLALLIDCS